MSNLEIAEMCARSGANCGSLFLDLRFRELVKTLLERHPVHLDRKLSLRDSLSHKVADKIAFMSSGVSGVLHA